MKAFYDIRDRKLFFSKGRSLADLLRFLIHWFFIPPLTDSM